MGWKTDFQILRYRFTEISRPARERLLCAMIRVNYGIPWSGDIPIVETFIPQADHIQIGHGQLTNLIERLSPFSDEPTEYGIRPKDGVELLDNTQTLYLGELTERILHPEDLEKTLITGLTDKSVA